jgi:tetratricopeptide (TPR) repeat protein
MKKLIAFMLLGISLIGNAQTNKTDSLKQLLQNEKKDTNRVLTLVRLGHVYLDSKPDTTLLLAIQGLSLSQQIGFVRGEASCLGSMADAYDNLGNYPKALENYFRALKINESINNSRGVRGNLGAIGSVYIEQGEIRLGLEYTFKAKAMAEKDKNERAIAIYLLNIGDDYRHIQLFDSAKMYTQQCLELVKRLEDTDLIGTALNNLGEIYSAMNENSVALKYYRLGIPYLQNAEDDDVQCETYLGMARIFQKTAQPDSCFHYARLSFSIAKNDGFTKRIYYASIFLTDYYKTTRNIDSAFAYQQVTMATKDSLFSEDKVKQIQNLSFQEKLRQQEIADEKQRVTEERKNNLQLIGITAFIITFILFFLLFVRRKTKPRTIEFFGIVALLLVFEFIALFIHPYIERWTHHRPVYMLLILVGIAAILVPIHHKTEKLIKEKLAHKIHPIHS